MAKRTLTPKQVKESEKAKSQSVAELGAEQYATEPPDNEAIFVYCKLPSGIIFPTPAGKVKLRGSNESRLVDANGNPMYGVTKVTEEQWTYIAEVYGSLDAFHTQPAIIFAAGTRDEGDAMADEYNPNVKTGLEQMDPTAENPNISEAER